MPKSIPTSKPVASPATTTTSSGLKQCKTNNHDRYPDQRQQCSTVHNVYPIESERCAPAAIF
jgi:hypothetical protein